MKAKVYRIPFKDCFTRAYCFGDLNAKTPLIILHGGPGGCAERYEPLENLAYEGIPLIFYDQLGCGYSRVPKWKNIDYNLNLYLEEFYNLLNYFKLERFNILGHSWGGMLALEYVCKHNHKGLEKLILFSTLPSTKLWNEEHKDMIKNYPTSEKEAILNEFEGKDFDKAQLRDGIKHFNKEHLGKKSTELYKFNRKKFPRTNREIYEKMWGKSEIFGTGTLKDWSVENVLSNVDVPTLILSGAFDESSPNMNKLMNEKIFNSKWVLLNKSHHVGYAEENKLVIEAIKKFIK